MPPEAPKGTGYYVQNRFLGFNVGKPRPYDGFPYTGTDAQREIGDRYEFHPLKNANHGKPLSVHHDRTRGVEVEVNGRIMSAPPVVELRSPIKVVTRMFTQGDPPQRSGKEPQLHGSWRPLVAPNFR